ncbi:MAG: hypothetical protein Tsb0020_10790 [Haliangiales bacterium]
MMDCLQDYARWATETFCHLPMLGLGGGEFALNLDDVYVPLAFSLDAHEHRKQYAKQHLSTAAATNPLPERVDVRRAFSLAGSTRHLFIRGEPGSGKTTLLRKLLWSVIRPGNDASPTGFCGDALGLSPDTVPVFLRLNELAGPSLDRAFSDVLDQALVHATMQDKTGHSAVPPGFGRWLWQRGHLLLLLDGLDEITDPNSRQALCRRLEDLAQKAHDRNIRLVVSSRFAGIQEQGAINLDHTLFLHLDVKPLDDEQVTTLVERWYAAAGRARARMRRERDTIAQKTACAQGEQLLAILARQTSAGLQELVSTPLLLTLLCLVFERGGRVPERRAEFYRTCLDILLGSWADERSYAHPLSVAESLAMLAPIAWSMHVEGRQYDLSDETLSQLLDAPIRRLQQQGRRKPVVTLNVVRDWFTRTAGVLTEYAPGEYGFIHLSLQEYLAAVHAADADHNEAALDQLVRRFGDKWWREVTLLFVSLRHHNGFEHLMRGVLATPLLEREGSHIGECLRAAHEPEIAPFLELIRDRRQPLARRTVALRWLRDHYDEKLIDAAAELALDPTPEADELRRLAEHIEACAPRFHDGNFTPKTDSGHVKVLSTTAAAELAETIVQSIPGCAWGYPAEASTALDPSRVSLADIIAVVAVIGADGRGSWQTTDARRGLLYALRRGIPVVIAMLDGVHRAAIPAFLRTTVHVAVPADSVGRLDLSQVRSALPVPPEQALEMHSEVTRLPLPKIQPLAAPVRVPTLGDADIAQSAGMRFLWLPAGEFTMGSSDADEMAYEDEKPAHRVAVAGFWLGATPVTNRAYGALMAAARLREPSAWRERRYNQPDQPVVGVDWYDAVRFCNALSKAEGLTRCYRFYRSSDSPNVVLLPGANGYRLPTEQEWEYACRAGRTTRWWFGDDEEQLADYAWYNANANNELKAVAGKPPNPWGLYDMLGNVREWVADRHSATDYTNKARGGYPIGPKHMPFARVMRGGGFSSESQCVRASFRGWDQPTTQLPENGFRCARSAT